MYVGGGQLCQESLDYLLVGAGGWAWEKEEGQVTGGRGLKSGSLGGFQGAHEPSRLYAKRSMCIFQGECVMAVSCSLKEWGCPRLPVADAVSAPQAPAIPFLFNSQRPDLRVAALALHLKPSLATRAASEQGDQKPGDWCLQERPSSSK